MAATNSEKRISLSAALSTKTSYKYLEFWVAGDTPLITHAWSEKARREMLEKQVKATRPGKQSRDPQADFVSSLYEMGEENGQKTYGFPATGFKNAVLSAAHKDKGIPKTVVMAGLWIDAQMVRSRPALAGAICDVPLLRIYGSQPEMREDMVRVGVGLNKTATLAYRGQFTTWAFFIRAKFNPDVLPLEQVLFLIQEAGTAYGVGEWRNEKKGMFGAFHPVIDQAEQDAWTAYKDGKGPLPTPTFSEAA